jgi:origin recognition complex subunit 3
VKDAPPGGGQERLRAGLISCGPKAGPQKGLLDQWQSTQSQKQTASVVSLDPTQASNLMTTLKNLIRAAITQVDGADGYQTFLNERKRRIQMSYDLELLEEFVASRAIQKCVVYLTDIEAFDMLLLADLIAVVSAWRDRIPFVLLLSISTTVDLFEARLPKSIIRLLDCKLFDTPTRADPCLEMFRSLHTPPSPLGITLGSAVSAVQRARHERGKLQPSHEIRNHVSLLCERALDTARPGA